VADSFSRQVGRRYWIGPAFSGCPARRGAAGPSAELANFPALRHERAVDERLLVRAAGQVAERLLVAPDPANEAIALLHRPVSLAQERVGAKLEGGHESAGAPLVLGAAAMGQPPRTTHLEVLALS
jgi:hypothetical protein